MPLFLNATPLYETTTRPNLALGLPLALLSISSAVGAFSEADKLAADARGTMTITGLASSLLAVYFLAVSFHEEHWIVYSNGMEVRVDYTF